MRFLFPATHRRGRVPCLLFAALISASLLILSLCVLAPQAKAALQNGAATTVDGTIHKIMQVDGGYELYIEDDSLDGKRVFITSQDEHSCQLLSHIHATGTLTSPCLEPITPTGN